MAFYCAGQPFSRLHQLTDICNILFYLIICSPYLNSMLFYCRSDSLSSLF